ncbi:MAG: histidine kinase [Kibdelosporangium sp.]
MALFGLLRRVPPAVVDAAIVLVVLAAHSAPFLVTTRTADPVAGWTLAQYLPVLGQAVPLCWRRRAPFPVLVTVMLASVVYSLADPDTARQPVPYAALVAIYSVAAHGTRRDRAWGLAFLTVGVAIQLTGLIVREPGADTVVRGVVMYVASWAVGRSAAHRRAHVRQLEHEKELEMRRAADRERAMIAREMHDILGHALSLMIVQAEAGPVVVHTQPARATAAFDAIATAGRDAMNQVRRLLGILDQDEGTPLVDQIPALVEHIDRAGPRTVLTVSGTPRRLPPNLELTAYRVVQEALTNAVKHADASAAAVRLDWQEASLLIDITDDGRGPSGGSGRGLAGLKERVLACGGSVSFGPGPDGRGFSVSARLPLS